MASLRVDQLKEHVASDPGTVLLDVREAWEVQFARIELAPALALHMPMNEVPQRLAELEGAPSVVCICHHGVRSAQVVAFLRQRGHPRVYNLAGGVDAWSTQIDRAVPRY